MYLHTNSILQYTIIRLSQKRTQRVETHLANVITVSLHQHLRRIIVHVHALHLSDRLHTLSDRCLGRPCESQVVAVVH